MVRQAKAETADVPTTRRNRTDPVSSSAAPLARDAFARAGFRDPTLVLHWTEIAGAEVARLCCPLKLSEGPTGGVLTLKAEPGAAVFLQHESQSLCQRINGYLGSAVIARLRFVQGPLAPRPRSELRSRPAGEIKPHDPALAYKGPEKLSEVLLKLARRRATRAGPD